MLALREFSVRTPSSRYFNINFFSSLGSSAYKDFESVDKALKVLRKTTEEDLLQPGWGIR